jgi:peptidoglycan hydrolase-like protein with peptidoglycan-binding domain
MGKKKTSSNNLKALTTNKVFLILIALLIAIICIFGFSTFAATNKKQPTFKILKPSEMTSTPQLIATIRLMSAKNSSSNVRQLQTDLNYLCKTPTKKLAVTGFYDNKTWVRFRGWQRAQKGIDGKTPLMTVDGVVGPKSWRLINLEYGQYQKAKYDCR